MSETLQIMPCQASPHGSPPEAIQPGRTGAPSAANSPLIAATDSITTMLINSQKNNGRKFSSNMHRSHFTFSETECKSRSKNCIFS